MARRRKRRPKEYSDRERLLWTARKLQRFCRLHPKDCPGCVLHRRVRPDFPECQPLWDAKRRLHAMILLLRWEDDFHGEIEARLKEVGG